MTDISEPDFTMDYSYPARGNGQGNLAEGMSSVFMFFRWGNRNLKREFVTQSLELSKHS